MKPSSSKYSSNSTISFANDFSIFGEPVRSIMENDFAECDRQTGISDAATLLSKKKASALLIKNEKNQYIGIITDKDFREKVIAKNLSSTIKAAEIMSSPIITVNPDTTVFDAIYLMNRYNIKHLVVEDDSGQVSGIISDHEIVTAQGYSPLHLLREISLAKNIEGLVEIHTQLIKIVNHMIRSGARIEMVNGLVTNVSDEILNKNIEFAIHEIGQPPVPFAFIVMGSEGRKEQTLKTDQDNAIIFQDDKGGGNGVNKEYFLKLGSMVCSYLDKTGYKLCNGNVMAQNPEWCLPLSEWKKLFNKWIHTPEPVALMHANIFFDFRCGYGDSNLVENLREHLFEKLSGRADLFYYHLARNAVHSMPLLGLFNTIKVEKSGQYKNALNIKRAMTPMVDFARIYALHNQIRATNTINRLNALYELGVFEKQEYENYTQAYIFLMQLRLTQQLENIIIYKTEADNYIKFKYLSHIEQRMLKEILMLIKKIQKRISIKFTAIA